MVLFSFSIPEHVPMILSGTKAKTTRNPRKVRLNGKKPYSVGEKVQLYYHSRQKLNCRNCIIPLNKCEKGFDYNRRTHFGYSCLPTAIQPCGANTNFFGESVITSIIHYTNQMLEGMLRTSQDGHEMWMPTFDKLNCGEQVSWSIADGFQGFDEADDWFSKQYGKDWIQRDWDCIKWNGQQIARRVA